jgi:hypothetical protein
MRARPGVLTLVVGAIALGVESVVLDARRSTVGAESAVIDHALDTGAAGHADGTSDAADNASERKRKTCAAYPWNCNCWDCAAHSNAASQIQELRRQRTVGLEDWVHQSEMRTLTLVASLRSLWGIDALGVSVRDLTRELQKRKSLAPAAAHAEAVRKGREKAARRTTAAASRLARAKHALALATTAANDAKARVVEARKQAEQVAAEGRKQSGAALAAERSKLDALHRSSSAERGSATKAHAEALARETAVQQAVLKASEALAAARGELNRSSPAVWAQRVQDAERSAVTAAAKNAEALRIRTGELAAVRRDSAARMAQMRAMHAAALAGVTAEAGAREKNALLELANLRQQVTEEMRGGRRGCRLHARCFR